MATALPAKAEEYKWGALAIDTSAPEKEPYYGVGGAEEEKEASDAALGFCKEAGGTECKVVVTYEKCGALAVSGKGDGGWGKAADKATAEAEALKGCKDSACKVVVSDCNSGE